MKNIEEKILMADKEIKQLQNKRKKLINQQKREKLYHSQVNGHKFTI